MVGIAIGLLGLALVVTSRALGSREASALRRDD
jgi:hypothetical protein